MAESFKNRVDALTGFASTEDDALSDWLTDGAREIINIFPSELLQYCTGATRLDDSPSSLAISTDTDMGKILYVTHSNGTRQIPCRLIPAAFSGLANDSSSLTYFGTDSDPVYWITGTQNSSDTTSAASILEVFPTPTSSKTAFVHHVTYPGVLHSWTGIDNFPDNAEYLVTLYAAQKALLRLMNNKNASLSALSVTAVPPDIPTITSVTFDDIAAQTINTTTVSFSTTAPSYASPNVTGDGATLTADSTALSTEQIGVDAEFLQFDQWFTALGEMIEDDEDIELASAQIEKINAYIQAYNIAMQDALNEFNDDMAEYQVEFQRSSLNANMAIQELIQEAQLAQQAGTQNAVNNMQAIINDNNNKVQKFQTEIAQYQAEVSSQVQEYTQNLQKDTLDYGWYAQQYAALKTDYMTGIQMLVSGGLPQPQQQARR
jgi:hypothetical protein